MRFVDTHCHIHASEFAKQYGRDADEIRKDAALTGVEQLICVGTDLRSSREAVQFTSSRDNCYATLALHPHEAAHLDDQEIETVLQELEEVLKSALAESKGNIVAIGETGLDYHYHKDELVRERQMRLFRGHVKLATAYNLPLSFHVRDAFVDFLRIIDEFKEVRGVVHSFSASEAELEMVLQRGLYVGLNGIMTFSKDPAQIAAAKKVPLQKLLLETDAPFLTPSPFRGTMCEPKHLVVTARFLANLRGEDIALLARETTRNAKELFGLS